MKVGLALSGGGARGFAHVGVLRILVEQGIPIDVVAGTSAGSIVGGAFAAGMSPSEILEMSRAVRWRNMTRPSLSPLGILSNAPLGRFVSRYFPVKRIEDCRIPFAAVACRPSTGEEVVFTTGDIAFAIRASCAVPGVFAPVREDGQLLVDGGVVIPTPAATVRGLGADIVIAVDLMASGATFRARPLSAAGLAIQSAMTLLRTLSQARHAEADVVIIPKVAHIRPDRLRTREECIALGEAAALERINEIKSLVSSK